jgi:hypothetical protein
MKTGARTPTTPVLVPRVVFLLVGVLLFAAEARAQNAHHLVIARGLESIRQALDRAGALPFKLAHHQT